MLFRIAGVNPFAGSPRFGSGAASGAPKSLKEQAKDVGHPHPDFATQGEINLLSVHKLINGGVAPDRQAAEHILRVAEFDTDPSPWTYTSPGNWD